MRVVVTAAVVVRVVVAAEVVVRVVAEVVTVMVVSGGRVALTFGMFLLTSNTSIFAKGGNSRGLSPRLTVVVVAVKVGGGGGVCGGGVDLVDTPSSVNTVVVCATGGAVLGFFADALDLEVVFVVVLELAVVLVVVLEVVTPRDVLEFPEVPDFSETAEVTADLPLSVVATAGCDSETSRESGLFTEYLSETELAGGV